MSFLEFFIWLLGGIMIFSFAVCCLVFGLISVWGIDEEQEEK